MGKAVKVFVVEGEELFSGFAFPAFLMNRSIIHFILNSSQSQSIRSR